MKKILKSFGLIIFIMAVVLMFSSCPWRSAEDEWALPRELWGNWESTGARTPTINMTITAHDFISNPTTGDYNNFVSSENLVDFPAIAGASDTNPVKYAARRTGPKTAEFWVVLNWFPLYKSYEIQPDGSCIFYNGFLDNLNFSGEGTRYIRK